MTNNADFFDSLDSSTHENIYLAVGKKISSNGIGAGKLTVVGDNGQSKTITLKDVLYVPSLTGK